MGLGNDDIRGEAVSGAVARREAILVTLAYSAWRSFNMARLRAVSGVLANDGNGTFRPGNKKPPGITRGV